MAKKLLSVLITATMLLSTMTSLCAAASDAEVILVEGESLSGYTVDESISGLSGGRFALTESWKALNEAPEYAEISMTITAPISGVYKMKCVALNCKNEWTNQFKFTLNGMDIVADSIWKGQSAASDMFAEYELETELRKGENTLALTATETRPKVTNAYASMMYLDYVSFAPVKTEVKEPIDPGETSVKIEGEAIGEYEVIANDNCNEGAYSAAAGNEMGMELYIPQSGIYTVRVVTSANLSEVILNDEKAAVSDAVITSGDFSAYEWSFSLEGGKNTIRLIASDDVMTLDYIAFYETSSIYIEGESLQNEEYTFEENDGLSGGKFAIHEIWKALDDAPGYAAIQVDFQVAKSGIYKMKCIALNCKNEWTNNFKFSMNEMETDAEELWVAQSPASDMFAEYELEVELLEGRNTLALIATETRQKVTDMYASMMYLDYVSFAPDEEKDAEYIKVKAEDTEYDTALDTDSGSTYAQADDTRSALITVSAYAAKSGCYLMRCRAGETNKLQIGVNGAFWDAKVNLKNSISDKLADFEVYVNLNYGKNDIGFRTTQPGEDGACHVYFAEVSFEPVESKIVVEGETLGGGNAELDPSGFVFLSVYGDDTVRITANFYAAAAGKYKMKYSAMTYPVNGESYLCKHSVDLNEDTWDAAQTMKGSSNAGGTMSMYEKEVTLQKGRNTFQLIVPEAREADKKAVMFFDYVSFVPVYNGGPITVQSESQTINVGEGFKPFLTDKAGVGICAENVKSISYDSSNKDIATVNETGLVAGINPGTSKITMKVVTDDGTYDAVTDVTVLEGIIIDSAELSGSHVVIKYAAATKYLSEHGAVFLIGRYDRIGSLQTAVREFHVCSADVSVENLYQTAEIPLDDTAGEIVLFVWNNSEEMTALYEPIILQK